MNKKSPQSIGTFVRWIIFWGAPMLPIISLVLIYDSLAHAIGEHVAPYVCLGIAAVITVACMVSYEHFPQRLIIPVGIIGWALTISLGFWYLNIHTTP